MPNGVCLADGYEVGRGVTVPLGGVRVPGAYPLVEKYMSSDEDEWVRRGGEAEALAPPQQNL